MIEKLGALEPRMLTDDELLHAAALAGLDGPGADATKEIAVRLGATQIAVTRWWCVTPAQWRCPACRRSKAEFARLNESGAMMGHIMAHHDHMTDLAIEAFHQASGARAHVVADELSEAFVKRAAEAVSAYDPILVCVDCNNADRRAKDGVPTDKRFSFSAQDISRFVIPHPNRDHELRLDVARTLWDGYRKTFQVRMGLIERIAAIGAAAENWYQGVTPHTANPKIVVESVGACLAHQLGLPNEAALRERYLRLQKQSSPQKGDLSKWRRTPPKAGGRPTSGEIDHAAFVTHAGHWRAVPDEWCCPGCRRSKAETVRPSGKFSWAFEVHKSKLWDMSAGVAVFVWICGDCRNVRVSLAKEAGVEAELVSLDDLSSIVRPHPHQRHAIDNDAVGEVVGRLQAWGGEEEWEFE